MKRYLLRDCITDKALIKKYLDEHTILKDKEKADYELYVCNTHLLYKYEDLETGWLWYTHCGPDEIFKICVYHL